MLEFIQFAFVLYNLKIKFETVLNHAPFVFQSSFKKPYYDSVKKKISEI